MSVLQTVKNFIDSVPPGTFPLIAAAFGLSAFQQKIHKWLKVQSPKVKVALSLLLSSILVGLPVLLGVLQTNAELFGAYTTLVFTSMTFAYRFVVKEAPAVQESLKIEESKVTTITTPVPQPQQPALTQTEDETFAGADS